MKVLESFILGVPYLFLKKIPYVWVGVVFLWGWPPVVSGILLAIVLVGLLMMVWQARAWESKIMRENSEGAAKAFIDRPHVARKFQLRNLALVLAGSGLVGWVLNGKIGISGLQWFLLLAGFMLLYKDALLFGAGATYIITDQGIGIRLVPGHVDYRLFFKFHEIWQAVRMQGAGAHPAALGCADAAETAERRGIAEIGPARGFLEDDPERAAGGADRPGEVLGTTGGACGGGEGGSFIHEVKAES